MIRWLPRDGANRWLEPLGALAVLGGGIYALTCLIIRGYLPQPFFYQAFDVWMDWFNTAFWSHNPGAYDSWKTLYPPVSFLFLKFLTLPYCYAFNEQWFSRDCDWFGAITMHGWFVLNIFVISKSLLKMDRSTALCRSFVVAAGMPMLDALERGNLLMIAFTFFALGYGPLLKSAKARWAAVGFAINFKIYLIATLPTFLLRRRWRWFEGAALATVVVYLVSWGLLGAGTPREIYNNLSDWNAGLNAGSGSFLDLWYATAYTPVLTLLNSGAFPSTLILGSSRTEYGALLISTLVHSTQAIIVIAAAATWLRPEAVPMFRLVNICGCLAMITSEAGGYVQAMIVFLTFFERWRGLGPKLAIIACYILSIPGDIYIDPVYPGTNLGFLNNGPIFYSYWITYGPFVRPALVLLVPFALSCTTLADVWRDIRARGAEGRLRFAGDLPLFANGGRALADGEHAPAIVPPAFGFPAAIAHWREGGDEQLEGVDAAARAAMRRRETWNLIAVCAASALVILLVLYLAGALRTSTR